MVADSLECPEGSSAAPVHFKSGDMYLTPHTVMEEGWKETSAWGLYMKPVFLHWLLYGMLGGYVEKGECHREYV